MNTKLKRIKIECIKTSDIRNRIYTFDQIKKNQNVAIRNVDIARYVTFIKTGR